MVGCFTENMYSDELGCVILTTAPPTPEEQSTLLVIGPNVFGVIVKFNVTILSQPFMVCKVS